MSDNSYRKVKDYRLTSLDLILDSGDIVSLLDMFAEINLYQDLFGSPLSCHITISDAIDLYDKLPLKNTEKLKIVFSSPGDQEITLNLSLYSRETINLSTAGNTSQYVLKFVSPEVIFDATTKISKAYTGKISDMVGAMWSELFTGSKPMMVEPTEGESTIVFPVNTPMNHFKDLSKKAKREKNPDEVNYFFFQDFKNFNFASLGAMFELPVKTNFIYGDPSAMGSLGPLALKSIVQDVFLVGKENILHEIKKGIYSGFVSGYDVKTKSFGGLRYDYKEAFDKIHHCNQHPLTTDPILESLGPLANYRTGFSGGSFSPDLMIKRKSQIGSFLNKRLKFTVAGNSSINVGDKIHMDFTQQSMSKTDDDGMDKYRSMDYIVSSVKHTINKAFGYTMTVEACSDSYAEPLPNQSRFEVENQQGRLPQ
jgi:hypothetical protein